MPRMVIERDGIAYEGDNLDPLHEAAQWCGKQALELARVGYLEEEPLNCFDHGPEVGGDGRTFHRWSCRVVMNTDRGRRVVVAKG